MISNLDIERRKTGIDHDSSYHQRVNKRISELSEYEARMLKSRKFTKYMEKLLQAYSCGEEGKYLPFFMPKHFAELVCYRFNSYGLESRIVYDYFNKSVFFVPRNRQIT